MLDKSWRQITVHESGTNNGTDISEQWLYFCKAVSDERESFQGH